jgi:U32 family peptidase
MKAADFELLLPVGQMEMAVAAIQNGADAIYVGFPGFNARGRSYDFEISELKQIIELCHLNYVKVNLAFNIVIFENEIPLVVEALQKVLPLKPDALIVQDLGLVQIIKEMCPEQVIHGSTQMTITNDLAIEFLNDLHIKRFVLGRENSISEIKLITERTSKELEVFVHGALCVSYSGQCFTSETLGGRSANRGQCAQSCRFSYDLFVDGEKKDLVDQSYLVSPKDLCGIAEIPELMKLGVKSFKVEGRLKTPAYVAQVAKSFRKAIEKTLEGSPLNQNQNQNEKNKMGVEYSRGFFPGWLNGVNHQGKFYDD